MHAVRVLMTALYVILRPLKLVPMLMGPSIDNTVNKVNADEMGGIENADMAKSEKGERASNAAIEQTIDAMVAENHNKALPKTILPLC